jgi:hypothetical protein
MHLESVRELKASLKEKLLAKLATTVEARSRAGRWAAGHAVEQSRARQREPCEEGR